MTEISQNLRNILNYIGNFDALGNSPTEIDSQKEYNLLGQYLNGSYQIENMCLENLSKKEKKSLIKILKQLQKNWGKPSKQKVEPEIVTIDNINNYLNKYKDLEYGFNKTLTKEQIKLAKNKLFEILKPFMQEIGIEKKYIDNIQDYDIDFLINRRLNTYNIINKAEENAKPVLNSINNPVSQVVLKNKVQEYILTKGVNSNINNPQNIDTGDGDFDEVVRQKTNVCWGLGGINALAQSDVGRSILNGNRYIDEESGIYAIHLKEAENSGLPSGGIYIITPQEIIDASQTIAEGEGDSVAYMLAINKYFKELRIHKPELANEMDELGKYTNDISEGNLSSRFFEIITGGTAFMIGEFSDVNNEIPKGISFGNRLSYDQISEIVQSKRGAAVLSLIDINSPDEMGHAISVVGVKDGNLLIQESMNNSELFLNTYKDFENKNIFKEIESINGAPTYILGKEEFKMYTKTYTVLRWE